MPWYFGDILGESISSSNNNCMVAQSGLISLHKSMPGFLLWKVLPHEVNIWYIFSTAKEEKELHASLPQNADH